MRYLRTNTDTIITVGPFIDDTDGVTLKTGLTISGERITFAIDSNSGSAPTLSINNLTAASTGTSNDLTYLTGASAAMMQLELSASNTNYLGRAILSITNSASHCPVFHEYTILPAVVYDAMIANSDLMQVDLTQIAGAVVAASVAQLGVNAVQAGATAWNSGAIKTTTFTAGALDAAAIAASAIGTSELASSAASAIGAAVWSHANVKTPLTAVQTFTEAASAISAYDAPTHTEVSASLLAIRTDTEDLQAQIGTDGAGLTNMPWNSSWDSEVESEVVDALVAYKVTTASLTAGSISANAPLTAVQTFAEAASALSAYDAPTHAEVSASLAAIIADTNDLQVQIGTDGAGLTNIPWNASWDAEVESEVVDGLVAYKVTTASLTAASISANVPLTAVQTYNEAASALSAYDAPTFAEVSASFAAVIADTEDIQTQIGTAGAGLSAIPWNSSWDSEVQSEVTDGLVAYNVTTASLTAASISANTPLTAIQTYNEAASAISAYDPATHAEISASLAAIVADTNELQTDDVPGLISALNNISIAQVYNEAASALSSYDPATHSEVSASLLAIRTDTEDIQTQIGTDGAGLTNIPWNSSWDAQAESEVIDALVAYKVTTASLTAASISAIAGLTAVQVYNEAASALNAYDAPTHAEVAASLANIVADTNELQTDNVPGLISALNDVSIVQVYSEVASALLAYDVPVNTEVAASLLEIRTDTEDIQTKIGTAGAGLSSIPWNAAWDSEVQSEVIDALVAYDVTTASLTAASISAISGLTALNVYNEAASALVAYDGPTHAEVSGSLFAIITDTEDIQTQIGVAGAGLNAISWNASWDSEVQSEVTDALEAYKVTTASLTAASISATGGLTTVDVYNETVNALVTYDVTTASLTAASISAIGGLTALNVFTEAASALSAYAPAQAGDLMGLADDAITSAKFDESTAFPIKSADVGSTQIARVGADGDTLESLSDEIAAVSVGAVDVSLAISATAVSALSSGNVSIATHNSFSQAITSTTTSALNTATDTWFAAKVADSDSDDDSIVLLSETVGLERLAKSIATSASNGSLTTSGSSGDWTITLTLDEDATSLLTDYVGYTLPAELKSMVSGSTLQLWTGDCIVSRGLIQAYS